MPQTITEALAEIATIDKRLPKKMQTMLPYVAHPEIVRDPLAGEGGSAAYLAREIQSFHDLQQRKVDLRAAIAKANAETELTIDGLTRSVADWLVWKRECYGLLRDLNSQLLTQAQRSRQQAHGQGVVARPGEPPAPVEIIVNIREQEMAESADRLEEVFGKLDGLLSLKNATTFVDV